MSELLEFQTPVGKLLDQQSATIALHEKQSTCLETQGEH